MDIATIYLCTAIAVCFMTLFLTDDHVLQKTAIVLFISCVVSNALNAAEVAYPWLQGANSAFDLVWVALVAALGWRNKHAISVPVCGFFIAMMALHVYTLIEDPESSRLYKTCLNLLFAGQLVCVGGWSVHQFIGNHLSGAGDRVSDRRAAHLRGHH